MDDIDLINTNDKKRLFYKSHFIDNYQLSILLLSIILIFLAMIYILINNPPRERLFLFIFGFLLFIGILITLWIYNDKLTRKLTKIETGYSKEKNRTIFTDLVLNSGYDIEFDNNYYIRAISENKFFIKQRELTIIFYDNEILINVVTASRYSRNYSYFSLRKIKKIIREKINAST